MVFTYLFSIREDHHLVSAMVFCFNQSYYLFSDAGRVGSRQYLDNLLGRDESPRRSCSIQRILQRSSRSTAYKRVICSFPGNKKYEAYWVIFLMMLCLHSRNFGIRSIFTSFLNESDAILHIIYWTCYRASIDAKMLPLFSRIRSQNKECCQKNPSVSLCFLRTQFQTAKFLLKRAELCLIVFFSIVLFILLKQLLLVYSWCDTQLFARQVLCSYCISSDYIHSIVCCVVATFSREPYFIKSLHWSCPIQCQKQPW